MCSVCGQVSAGGAGAGPQLMALVPSFLVGGQQTVLCERCGARGICPTGVSACSVFVFRIPQQEMCFLGWFFSG